MNGKTACLALISLSLCAQAFGVNLRERKVVVDTEKAELCLESRCYPVLVGKDTPKGTFDLNIVKTNRRGYGGDVMKFKEDKKYLYAIHRVWTLKPEERRMQRIASPNPADRHITHGCINVTDEVYEKLKAYFVVEIR
ncbi:L,D-transpeptidase [Uruburuella testudinis]|uniref:L,D-transpeptidase n=1 Tax=Uruburuella testudinis TaxID=1282863 RepID=A0ABY4DSH2_9NEIS|nr:L,D-transpeptidase [Uruburuella testudinis]UOO81821.1 L,D-transpeptidase [Uruburuella testudinis]